MLKANINELVGTIQNGLRAVDKMETKNLSRKNNEENKRAI